MPNVFDEALSAAPAAKRNVFDDAIAAAPKPPNVFDHAIAAQSSAPLNPSEFTAPPVDEPIKFEFRDSSGRTNSAPPPAPTYSTSTGEDLSNVPGRAMGLLKRTAAGASEMLYELGPVQDIVGLRQNPAEFHEQTAAMREQGTKDIAAHPIQREFIRKPTDVGTGLAPMIVGGAVAGPVGAGAAMALQSGGDVNNAVYEDRIAKGFTPEQAREQAAMPSVGAGAVGAVAGPVFAGPSAMAGGGLVKGLARTAIGGTVGAAIQNPATDAIESAATGRPMRSVFDHAEEALLSGAMNMGIHGVTHALPELARRGAPEASPVEHTAAKSVSDVQRPVEQPKPAESQPSVFDQAEAQNKAATPTKSPEPPVEQLPLQELRVKDGTDGFRKTAIASDLGANPGVEPSVIGDGHNAEILNPVVPLEAVDVVNKLATSELPAKVILHNPSVLMDAGPAFTNMAVSAGLLDPATLALTRTATESLRLGTNDAKQLAALLTRSVVRTPAENPAASVGAELPRTLDPIGGNARTTLQAGDDSHSANIPEQGSQPQPEPAAILEPAAPAEAAAQRIDVKPEEAASTAPPTTGKFDQLELWARDRIKSKRESQSEKLATLTPEQRRQRGSAGSLDPEEIILHAIVGAAKIGKGVKKLADWSVEMAKEFPEATRATIAAAWRTANRLTKMDEETRAQFVAAQFQQKQSEAVKTTIRHESGQIDTSRAVSELDALTSGMQKAQRASATAQRTGIKLGMAAEKNKAATAAQDEPASIPLKQAITSRLAAEQRASATGRAAGVEETTGLKNELARIVREHLPPEERGKMLTQVAQANTLGDLRLGVQKVRNVLADHDAKLALARAEKLTGTLKLDPPDRTAPELSEADQAAALGTKMVQKLGREEPLRQVDLTKLADPYRTETRKLIEQAKIAKGALAKAKTIDAKYAAIDRFQEVERGIREQVAEHAALKESRVGEKVMQREQVVNDLVSKVKPKPTATSEIPTTEAPRDASVVKRLLGRGSLSMETIATHLDPEKGDTYGVTIANVRHAQERYMGEQHRWTDHLTGALKEAGYERGTAKLDKFLNEKTTIDLPDVGKVTLTRDQMIGLRAASTDPQTASLIQQGAKWSFRNNPLAKPFHVSLMDIQAIDNMLTPGEKKLAQSFKDYNKKNLTAPMMDASVRLRGWAPDPHEGYFPRARNRQQNVAEGIPAGWRGQFREAMENVSSLKERAPDLKQPLFVPGFIETTDRYVKDAAKVIHLAEPVRTAAMVYEDPRSRQALEQRFGPSMNKRIDSFLLDTMQVQQRPPAEWYDKASQFVTRSIARAWLQVNPSPVLKNVFGGTTKLLPAFDVQDWTHGVTKMFSPDVHKRMLETSDVAWNRYNGGLYGQYSPVTGKHVETVAEMKFSEALKTGKMGAAVDALPFMEWADSVPFRAAYAASEHFVDRTMPGASPEAKRRAVLDKFHDAVYQTQNGTSSTEISGLASGARKNALAAPLFLFTSDNNKSYNMLARIKGADAQTRTKILLAVGLNAVLNAAIGYGLKRGATELGRAISGAQRDPEQSEKDRGNADYDLAKNLLSPIYGAGLLTEFVRGSISGGGAQPSQTDPLHDMETQAINAIINSAKAISRYASTVDDSPDEKKAMESLQKALWNLTSTGAQVSGIPVVPIANLVKRGMTAGTYTPPDPRSVERKKLAAETKQRRVGLAGNVQTLLAEKNQLDAIGKSKLTDQERSRRAELNGVEQAYLKWQESAKKGNAENVKYWREEMESRVKALNDSKASTPK